jgi:PKD repeat protein
MKKKLMMYLIFILSINLVLASFTLNDNVSLEAEYVRGDIISGAINISILDESIDYLLTSNLDGSITLGNFLTSNGERDFCSTANCVSDYFYDNPTTAKVIDISPSQNVTVGFLVTGTGITVTRLDFSLGSNFPRSETTPLSMQFPGSVDWNFDTFSGIHENPIITYDPTTSMNQFIGGAEYCQKINLPTTRSIRVKPHIVESFSSNFSMMLYKGSSSIVSGQCDYGDDIAGCIIEPLYTITEGEYYICMSDTNSQGKNLKKENLKAIKSGYLHSGGSFIPTDVNYFIEVRAESYSDASDLNLSSQLAQIPGVATNYILEKYDGACTSGCVLPLKFLGISQQLSLDGLSLEYTTTETGGVQETTFYSVSKTPAKVNFEGIVQLDKLGFKIAEEDKFKLYFNGAEIISEDISVKANIIDGIFPTNVPAGIPIEFGIISNGDISGIIFEWSFGDGVNETSSTTNKTHSYSEIKNYTLTIKARKDNLTEIKSFQISATSPSTIILNVLQQKFDILEDLEEMSSGISLSKEVKDALQLSKFRYELSELLLEFNATGGNESRMVAVATKLFEQKIPVNFTMDKTTDFLILESGDIDLIALSKVSGENILSNPELYKTAIQKWFANNLVVDIEETIMWIQYEGSAESIGMKSYKLDIASSYNDTSYLIINQPIDSLDFSSGANAIGSGESTYVAINPKEKKSLIITSYGNTNPVFFMSTKPSLLTLDENDVSINNECNVDGFCDEGENSKNCRDDCNPKFFLIFYLILIAFLFIVSFGGISIWYQRHKEDILFGDRKQLFNLVSFIKIAKDKGSGNDEIEKALIAKGWVKEKIDYAIEKERSVDKIGLSSFNNYIDKRLYSDNAITQTQQQTSQKINKPNSQGIRRTK